MPVEQFLDDDGGARAAEGLLDEDLLDGLVGLGHVVADQDAFAERQTVGFDGATSAERGGEARSGGGIGEGAGAGGRDAVFLHEPLGEDLGGFELGGLLVRAPDAQAVLLPEVHDAERQGIVRPDDGEVGAVFLGEGAQAGQVLRAEVDALDGGAVLAPGVPGRCRHCRGRTTSG